MMRTVLNCCSLLVLLLQCADSADVKEASYEGEEIKPLRIIPEYLRKPENRRVSFQCVPDPTMNLTVQWFNSNGTNIRDLNSSRVNYTDDGVLMFDGTRLTDAGNYTCRSDDGMYHAFSYLDVFVMPTYLMESMILLIINLVLVCVFGLCFVYTSIKARRLENKQLSSLKKQRL